MSPAPFRPRRRQLVCAALLTVFLRGPVPHAWADVEASRHPAHLARCQPAHETNPGRDGTTLETTRTWATRSSVSVLSIAPLEGVRHPGRWPGVSLEPCFRNPDPSHATRARAAVSMVLNGAKDKSVVVQSVAAISRDNRIDTKCLEDAFRKQWSEPIDGPALRLQLEVNFEIYCQVTSVPTSASSSPQSRVGQHRPPDSKARFTPGAGFADPPRKKRSTAEAGTSQPTATQERD